MIYHGQAWLLVAASEAQPSSPRLAFLGAKEASVRSLGAYEALSSKAKAQAIVPAENKRIPKRSALDPRIKKGFAIKRKEAPGPKACLQSQAGKGEPVTTCVHVTSSLYISNM
jgi:hypothetical protein